jgi:hypothetical protein
MSVFGRKPETGDAGASLLDRLSDGGLHKKKDLTALCDASRVVDATSTTMHYTTCLLPPCLLSVASSPNAISLPLVR